MTKKIFLLIIILFFSKNTLLAENKIIISVNDEIITNLDIKKEINYLTILNPDLAQINLSKKISLAKSSLISQIIKKKEIDKLLTTESKDISIDEYIKNFYLTLGFKNINDFEDMLNQNNNYNISDIKEKFKIDYLWNELIYIKFINQVKIDKDKLLLKVKRFNQNTKKNYLISEIVFQKNKEKSLNELIKEINLSIKEIGFNNTANIYSISDSAKFGGKIGWVDSLSLSQKISDKINFLKKNEISEPIKVGNNFLIIKIEDLEIEKINIDEKKELEKIINLETNKQLNRFSKTYFNKLKLNYYINEK